MPTRHFRLRFKDGTVEDYHGPYVSVRLFELYGEGRLGEFEGFEEVEEMK